MRTTTPSSRANTVVLAVLAVLLGSTPLSAQEKYADPDDPAVGAAARSALPGVVLPIVAKVVSIVGVTTGIQAVLEDLGAKVTDREIKIDLAADVLFDFDEADVKQAAAEELAKVGTVLGEHPTAPVTIEGHTDSKGGDAYNQRLSEERAEAVKAWLVENAGIESERITTRGWGETRPLVPNETPEGQDDPEGREKNRRVEITVTTSEES